MKEVLLRIFIGVVGFGCTYLCGAFYSVSFNIGCWQQDTRLNVILFGFGIGCAFAIFPSSNLKKNKE